MNIEKNLIVESKSNKDVLLDLYYPSKYEDSTVVLFAHGFKGFKDWGHWELIAQKMVEAGFVFIKFNFSHNGTTTAEPTHFGDLEAFGQNNYTKELADIDAVINWLSNKKDFLSTRQIQNLTLIGHSRGGAISIVKAKQDDRISRVVTWAAVSQLDYAWQDEAMVQHWQSAGVYHILNGRTKQEMPLYYQIYEDYKNKEQDYSVEKCARQLNKPCLITHGTDDPAVPVQAADQLHNWIEDAVLFLIEGANHVFGGSHPYVSSHLHKHAQLLVDKTISFIKEKR